MKYMLRPTKVDVIQLKSDLKDLKEVLDFIKGTSAILRHDGIMLKTEQGNGVVLFDDYIIKNKQGEVFACRKEIFDQLYIPVVEPTESYIKTLFESLRDKYYSKEITPHGVAVSLYKGGHYAYIPSDEEALECIGAMKIKTLQQKLNELEEGYYYIEKGKVHPTDWTQDASYDESINLLEREE